MTLAQRRVFDSKLCLLPKKKVVCNCEPDYDYLFAFLWLNIIWWALMPAFGALYKL